MIKIKYHSICIYKNSNKIFIHWRTHMSEIQKNLVSKIKTIIHSYSIPLDTPVNWSDLLTVVQQENQKMSKPKNKEQLKRELLRPIEQSLKGKNKVENPDDIHNCVALGTLYSLEKNIINIEKSYRYYKMAADAGNAKAEYHLAKLINEKWKEIKSLKEKETEVAELYRKHLESSASRGYLDAENQLANEYYFGGCFIKSDKKKAFELLKKTSHKDTVIKQKLAECYMSGIGTDKNVKEGLRLLIELATKDKWIGALFSLGCWYESDSGGNDKKKAFQFFVSGEAKGNINCAIKVAKCYLSGDGTNKDVKQGIEKLNDLAKKSIKGKMALGEIYSEGVYVAKDHSKAFDIYKEAAKTDQEALLKVAECYYFGLGVNQNFEEARSLLEKCASHGFPYALGLLGEIYEKGNGVFKDEEKSFKYFEQAAELLNISAICKISECYRFGKGVPQDTKKAFEIILQASSSGDSTIRSYLARYYLEGMGCEINYEKGIALSEEIVKSNSTENKEISLLSLINCYREGFGVTKDPKRIRELINQLETIEKKSKAGLYMLFSYYKSNLAEDSTLPKAFSFLKSLTEMNEEYLSELGYFYLKGFGTPKNIKAAMGCFKEGVAKHDPNCMNLLGLCYLQVFCEAKLNHTKAFNLFKTSSDAGNNEAVNNLGWCYLQGFGTERDLVKAFQLFEAAYKNGSDTAKKNLAWCYLTGSGVKADKTQAEKLFDTKDSKLNKDAKLELENDKIVSEKNSAPQFQMGLSWDYISEKNCYKANHQNDNKDCKTQYFLALCLHEGLGVKQNVSLAFEQFRKLNDCKDWCTDNKLTVREGQALLAEFYEKRIQEKDPLAAYFLATFYELGLGVDLDMRKALTYYGLATYLGSPYSENIVGILHEQGIKQENEIILVPNPPIAFYYYSKAAQKGNIDAVMNLGRCYEEGVGVNIDAKKAQEYFDSARKKVNR